MNSPSTDTPDWGVTTAADIEYRYVERSFG
jgi:hypothetical protein